MSHSENSTAYPTHSQAPTAAKRRLAAGPTRLGMVLVLAGLCAVCVCGVSVYRLHALQAAVDRVDGQLVWSESILSLTTSGRWHPSHPETGLISGLIPSIQSAKIVGRDLSDADLHFLSQLTSLRSLELHSDRATDRVLSVISGLPHLKSLTISGTQFSAQGMLKLRSAKSLVRVAVSEQHFSAIELAVLRVELAGLNSTQGPEAGAEKSMPAHRSLASMSIDIPSALL